MLSRHMSGLVLFFACYSLVSSRLRQFDRSIKLLPVVWDYSAARPGDEAPIRGVCYVEAGHSSSGIVKARSCGVGWGGAAFSTHTFFLGPVSIIIIIIIIIIPCAWMQGSSGSMPCRLA